MKYIKVKDHPGLVRDSGSKAILNTNKTELDKYRDERDRKLRAAKAIDEVEKLRSDVDEIKEMLQQLLKKF